MNSIIEAVTSKALLDQYTIDELTTDAGSAECLIDRNYQNFKYCNALGGWLYWTGSRWRVDSSALVQQVMCLGREMMEQAADKKNKGDRDCLSRHGSYLLSEPGIRRVVKLAEHDSRIRVSPEDFDADPYLINVLNGTVDLRTGEKRDHDRNDLITKLAPVAYDPEAKATEWTNFLERVIPNPAVRHYLMQCVGYSAFGAVWEHMMLILYGTGANGKSTFIESIKGVLGDYAHKTHTDALMKKNNGGGATPEVVQLKGKRFVFASETGEGDRLAESTIKDITGGDTINARDLYKSPMQFEPSHTLWLSTNHKPRAEGTDFGIRRRLKLIPFMVRIAEEDQDKQLPEKLRNELSGILNWIIEGAKLYSQQEGLEEPEEVKQATGAYFDEQDKVKQFLDEECVTGRTIYHVTKSNLYTAYKVWCEDTGLYPESQTRFGGRLKEREDLSIEETRVGKNRDRAWLGIGLLSELKPYE